MLDLCVKGGPLGPARVAEAGRWAYVPAGVSADDRTFVAQVHGASMEPRIPSGSWCLFRSYAEDAAASVALDRRRVLVEVAGDTEADNEARYALKRVVITKRDGEGAIVEIELRSDNAKFPPIRLTEGHARVAIRAELMRVLRG